MKNMTEQQLIKKLIEERDLAIKQLESIGVGLGDNMDHVKKALEKQKKKTQKTERGCMKRKGWDGTILSEGKILCCDCPAYIDPKCVCLAVEVMHFPVEEDGE